jgi:hypothetical protein
MLMNNLLKTSSPIHWGLLGGLFILFSVTDVLTRLSVSENEFQKDSKATEQRSDSSNHSKKVLFDDVIELYLAYDVEKKITPPKKKLAEKKGISLEQQNNQQGDLANFFIEDKKYILSGVFYEKQYFAVLLETNLNTNKVIEVKVIPGQILSPYKVGKITKHSIEFLYEDKTIKLMIF